MLRVLTLSTLFPDAHRRTFGGFVERQTLALAAESDVAVELVAPIGLPVWPLSLHPHYRPLARLPGVEAWKGLRLYRPRFTVWPLVGTGRSAAALAKILLPLLERIREIFPFDVIDSEFFWPDGVAAARIGRALGVPVSIKARGSDIDLWGSRPAHLKQMLEAARAAAGLLAVSEALKQRMVALGMEESKIFVHYTGIDAELFRPQDRAAAKAALGLAGPLIATVGALIPLKGQRLALDALALLPEASLLVVGGGPDRATLERHAAELGLGDRVRFLGSISHNRLPPILAAADVTLLASEREGLANVWIESIACGTPVVIAETGAAREVVDRPAAGLVVPRDAAALAAAVRTILADPPAQDSVREAALRFGWDRNASELAAYLRRLAQRH